MIGDVTDISCYSLVICVHSFNYLLKSFDVLIGLFVPESLTLVSASIFYPGAVIKYPDENSVRREECGWHTV